MREQLGVSENHKAITIDGVAIAYEDVGDGPTLICLHAIGHGGKDFDYLRRYFGERLRIITLDWPGQGRSGDDHEATSAKRYYDHLVEFVDRLNIKKPIILGNSIGGAAAIHYAASHPENTRALVLADPGGLVEIDKTVERFIRLMVLFFAAGRKRKWWYKWAFARYYSIVLKGRHARPQKKKIITSAYEIAPVLEQAWISFGAPDADIRHLAVSTQCPVLFTWAKGDKVIAFDRCVETVRQFPNADVKFFKGGHAAFLEQPKAFNKQFELFLRTLGIG